MEALSVALRQGMLASTLERATWWEDLLLVTHMVMDRLQAISIKSISKMLNWSGSLEICRKKIRKYKVKQPKSCSSISLNTKRTATTISLTSSRKCLIQKKWSTSLVLFWQLRTLLELAVKHALFIMSRWSCLQFWTDSRSIQIQTMYSSRRW